MSPSHSGFVDGPPTDAGDAQYRDQDRLSRYFGDRVLAEISGTGERDGDAKAMADLPSDTYFAGSVISSEQADHSGLSRDLQAKLSPSAIQAEFLFDPRTATKLTVVVSGNVYYRSFPTYEEQTGDDAVAVVKEEDSEDGDYDEEGSEGELAQVFRRIEFESSPIEITIPSMDQFEERDIVTAGVERSVLRTLTNQLRDRVRAIDEEEASPPVWRAAADLPDPQSITLGNLDGADTGSHVEVDNYTGDYQFPPGLLDRDDNDLERENFETIVERIIRQAPDAPFVPPWDLDVQCEFAEEDGLVRGTLTVENTSSPNADTTGYDTDYGADTYDTTLFDLTAEISLSKGEFQDFTFERLEEDFRYDRKLPGHGTNCTVTRIDESTLRTAYLPTHRQRRYVTRDPDSFATSLDTSFETLSDLEGGGLDALENIADQMETYGLETYDEYLDEYESDPDFRAEDREDFQEDREAFRQEIHRFRRGIECLRWDLSSGDGHVARSFELMNQTFVEKVTDEDGDMEYDSWRLFQLVFILRVVPDIASREYDEWAEVNWREGEDAKNFNGSDLEALDVVDILWFPTGGGKTEAYLGLAVFNAFFDRKRGKRYGVTAWTRFPLRLLSLQQTQRIGEILMHAELLRLQEPGIAGDGYFPFTLGYLVGSKNTPNKLSNYAKGRNADPEDFRKDFERYADPEAESLREEVKIFPSCPVCGSEVKIRATDDLRLAHYCTAPAEECEYQGRDRHGSEDYRIFADDELPIHIVDNELYRYAPTMIVGTIDKITAVGYERKSAHLYAGKMSHWCPDHGFASFDECTEKYGCHSRYGGDNSDEGRHLVRLEQTPFGSPYDIAPGLQIQDELHLLEESLGTFDSHFETFVDAYQRYNGEQRTKIIGATATIEEYDEQARELYLRKAERFPVQGPEVGENFYATTKDTTRRHFVGIMPHGKTHINAIIQLNYFYLRAIESLRQEAREADSTLDLVAELGFETVGDNDDLLDLLDLYETALTYTISKRDKNRFTQSMRGQIAGYLREDGLREPYLAELTGDTPFDDVEDILGNLEDPPQEVEDRYNTIAATNMISHGVDVDRFNFMIFFGMPRQTAEYIQSSSRAGRKHPGVVFLCFNPARERDQSHYHLFEKYHEYLDRLVEPVPLNRWSHFSVRRTLPSMIFAWNLNQWLYESGERLFFGDQTSELIRSLQSGRGRSYGISIDDSTEFQELLERSYGSDLVGELPEAFREILDKERDRAFTNLENVQSDMASDALDPGPMTSLRDIDEPIPFKPHDRENRQLFNTLSRR
jgi:hypothetical protein